ncbi:MAG TPA: nucleotidyltransferase family protein [Flavipsychrobacter sp.]|nr:nucleotidyltransferase family protein [Flavipsychrobacter sp.]
MKAMIFAAGLGTRLKPFTDHHPKALAEVSGKTLLEHAIRYLQRFGIEDVIVNVHHFAEQIEAVIEENSGFGSWVTVSDEREVVLETGGGLKKAGWYFEGETDFVVMNVDVLTNLDLGKMIEAHQQSDAMATLAVMERNSSRQLLFDEHMILCGWTNNSTGEQRISREVLSLRPFAFSGVQVLSTEIFDMPFQGKFSVIDVYLHFAKTKLIKGYDHTGNIFIDVGKPESLEKAGYLFGN